MPEEKKTLWDLPAAPEPVPKQEPIEKPVTVPEEKFVYPTSHLKNFDIIDKSTKLYGHEYTLSKKAVWYTTHSLPLRKTVVELGAITVDLRFHSAFVIKSGGGKNSIYSFLTDIAEKLNLVNENPTSLHPEQLIGKTTKDGDVYEKSYGYLADDLVMFDEATELLTNKDYEEARKYLNIAMNCYGTNTVTKKATGIPFNQRVKYNPYCVIVFLFQPFVFGEKVILVGTLRRPSVIVHLKIEDEEKEDELVTEKIDAVPINNNFLQPLIKNLIEMTTNITWSEDFLWKVKECFPDIKIELEPSSCLFTPETKERLKVLVKELIKQGRNHSEKGNNFTTLVRFQLLDTLVKMSCIQAATELRSDVSVKDVECAYVDYAEFFQDTLDYVNEKTIGNLDYKSIKKDLSQDDIDVINWLIGQGAVSFETSKISSEKLKDYIAEKFNLEQSGARARYDTMKSAGLIGYKQDGSHSSKVWVKGDKDAKGATLKVGFNREEYYKIIKKYNLNNNKINNNITSSITTPSTTLAPLTPLAPSSSDVKETKT